jgi:hypothetical protein
VGWGGVGWGGVGGGVHFEVVVIPTINWGANTMD